MRTVIILGLISIVLFPCNAESSEYSADDNPLETKTDKIIHRHAVEIMNDKSMMGLSLGLFVEGKVYFYNYGSIEKGKDVLPTRNTIYEIGSLTKTFTGILLAHALLEKRISIDADIRTYLKEDYENLEFDGSPISVIDLANHTSGMPEDILPEALYSLKNPTMFDIVNLFEGDTGSMFLEDLHKTEIKTLPGDAFQYSNAGMIVLGIILENVNEITYSGLIENYITRPLEMNDTETVFWECDTLKYTKGYDRDGNIMPHITFQIAGAAGGLKSTTHDMVRYLVENIKETDEAVLLSHKLTTGTDKQGMGLGWQIKKDSRGEKQIWHDGGEPGFSSYCVIVPGRNIGIICLANQAGRQYQLSILCDNVISEIESK